MIDDTGQGPDYKDTWIYKAGVRDASRTLTEQEKDTRRAILLGILADFAGMAVPVGNYSKTAKKIEKLFKEYE